MLLAIQLRPLSAHRSHQRTREPDDRRRYRCESAFVSWQTDAAAVHRRTIALALLTRLMWPRLSVENIINLKWSWLCLKLFFRTDGSSGVGCICPKRDIVQWTTCQKRNAKSIIKRIVGVSIPDKREKLIFIFEMDSYSQLTCRQHETNNEEYQLHQK